MSRSTEYDGAREDDHSLSIRSTSSKKSDCVLTYHDSDAVERHSCHEKDDVSHELEKDPSLDLRQTTSNALSRVASRITTRSLPEPPPPPDGGLPAWTQVAMGWLVNLITWGWVNSFGAFQDYYDMNLGVSASTVAWIGAITSFLTFGLGAFSGRLLDAGYFLPTLMVGGAIQILGIFTMSASTKYWQLMITQGILTGLGGGIFFTPAAGVVGTYFSKRRSLALGIATSGNAAGGIIYPVLVQQLLPKLGFAWTVRVLGFLNLGCLCLVIAFMRPRLPPRKSGPIVDLSAFKEPPYALFVAGLFFVMGPIYYTFYFIASFGNQVVGLSLSTSTTIVIVLNGVGIPARIIAPHLADRFQPLNINTPVIFCLTIVAFSWLAVSNVTGVWVFTCFYGIVSAAFQCLTPSTIAILTPDMKMFGTRLGMAFTTLSFATLTGPPIGGAIQGAQNGKFSGATVWAALSTGIALLLVVAARIEKLGWRLSNS